jgi:hypothetical protein
MEDKASETRKKNKYYFSFSNILDCYMKGILTAEELKSGWFVLGWRKGDLIGGSGGVPNKVTYYNKNLPINYNIGVVTPDKIDPDILAKYNILKQIFIERDNEGCVIWNPGVTNYPQRARDYIKAGNDVFFWRTWVTESMIKFQEEDDYD